MDIDADYGDEQDHRAAQQAPGGSSVEVCKAGLTICAFVEDADALS
jgi:hypothetical protein